jgi:hypothetical protein
MLFDINAYVTNYGNKSTLLHCFVYGTENIIFRKAKSNHFDIAARLGGVIVLIGLCFGFEADLTVSGNSVDEAANIRPEQL